MKQQMKTQETVKIEKRDNLNDVSPFSNIQDAFDVGEVVIVGSSRHRYSVVGQLDVFSVRFHVLRCDHDNKLEHSPFSLKY